MECSRGGSGWGCNEEVVGLWIPFKLEVRFRCFFVTVTFARSGDEGGVFVLPSSKLPMEDDLRRFATLRRSTGAIAMMEGSDGSKERNVCVSVVAIAHQYAGQWRDVTAMPRSLRESVTCFYVGRPRPHA
jgi:hypothetical protein